LPGRSVTTGKIGTVPTKKWVGARALVLSIWGHLRFPPTFYFAVGRRLGIKQSTRPSASAGKRHWGDDKDYGPEKVSFGSRRKLSVLFSDCRVPGRRLKKLDSLEPQTPPNKHRQKLPGGKPFFAWGNTRPKKNCWGRGFGRQIEILRCCEAIRPVGLVDTDDNFLMGRGNWPKQTTAGPANRFFAAGRSSGIAGTLGENRRLSGCVRCGVRELDYNDGLTGRHSGPGGGPRWLSTAQKWGLASACSKKKNGVGHVR